MMDQELATRSSELEDGPARDPEPRRGAGGAHASRLRSLLSRAADAFDWVLYSGSRSAAVIGALALIMRMPLAGGSIIAPDSELYLLTAHDLLSGNGFTSGGDFRTPGYPIFLALAEVMPGGTAAAAVFAQHLLGVALAVAVVMVARRYFGPITAVIAGALVAVTAYMPDIEHWVLPDFLFAVALFASTVALTEAALQGLRFRLLVLTGLLFAATTYIKPNGVVLLGAVPIVLAVATRRWKPTLVASTVIAAVMLVALAPWSLRNQVHYGHPLLSVQGGEALYLRVFDLDHMPIPTDAPHGAFVKRIYDRTYRGKPVGSEQASYSAVYTALLARGFTPHEATGIQGNLALTAIKRDPRAYARGTTRNVSNFHLLWVTSPYRSVAATEAAQGTHDGGLLGAVGSVTSRGWYLFNRLMPLWWWFSLAALGGFLLILSHEWRLQVAATAFGLMWFIVALATSLTNHIELRFMLQTSPLVWIFGSAGAVFFVKSVLQRVRWLAESRAHESL
jgi:4-amino-4-deoxy-L-arabinose transferase-like glycosyltransferase